MGLKQYKPNTAGLRGRVNIDYDIVTTSSPKKSLLSKSKKSAGRNNEGHLTVRHRGGGNRKRYRMVDFDSKLNDGIQGVVQSIEYDPFRTSYIVLIKYANGRYGYLLAWNGVKVGDKISSGEKADITSGSRLPIYAIPTGSVIHNVELHIGKGGQLARSAGSSAVLMAKSNDYATVKLPSGEVRLIHVNCRASLGTVSNSEHRNIILGKAGATRHRGRRPYVRGSVMNPCDHPHGGGEGRAPIGRARPLSPQGKPALGKKTRNPRKITSRFIVKRRNK